MKTFMPHLATLPSRRNPGPRPAARPRAGRSAGVPFPHGDEVGASLRERLETLSASLRVARRAATLAPERARREILWCRDEIRRIEAARAAGGDRAEEFASLLGRLRDDLSSLLLEQFVPGRMRRGA